MVIEMTKYSFILLEEETEGFLKRLQELGVVDIARSRKPVDARSSAMMEKAASMKKAVAILDKAEYREDPDLQAIEAAAGKAVPENDLNVQVLNASERLAELGERLANTQRKAKDLLPWGKFDKAALDRLSAIGYTVRFYTVGRKSFKEDWKQEYAIQVVSEDSSYVRFVTVADKSKPYNFPVNECTAPDESYEDALAEAESIRKEMINLKGLLLNLKDHTDEIKEEYGKEITALDLYLAGTTGETAAENRLNVFTGFAPHTCDGQLQKEFDRMGIFYLSEKATEEDNPPIKLKNNRFARMFEVLTGMYGMPEYREYDPTPVLGPFFLLFFALCLGDAGYGLVLIAISYFLKKKMPGMANLAPLVMTLGIGSFFIGIFMGTFFGFNLLELSFIPDWLKKCMLSGEVAGFPAAMVLAIGIGVLNICVAMVMKAMCFTHRFGFKNTLGTWGWTLLVVGGVVLGGVTLLGLLQLEVAKWIFIVLAVISGAGIYLLNNIKRNPFVNIGAGLWDTYNMATGILGDTLSFIRLYALGLAGGMLGSTFNMLGGMLMDSCPVPGLNWLLFALIFLIGHALNIALSCLGAFVHPLRLTFVEFFKNSGYEGSGKPYNPLTPEKEEL